MDPTPGSSGLPQRRESGPLASQELTNTTWAGRIVNAAAPPGPIDISELFRQGELSQVRVLEKPSRLVVLDETTRVQQFLKQHPFSHGELSREQVEEILSKCRRSKTWLLRYSSNQKQMIVSQIEIIKKRSFVSKDVPNSVRLEFKHQLTISSSSGISSTLEQLKSSYNRGYLVVPAAALRSNPPSPFQPIYKISFKKLNDYNDFKALWMSAGIDKDFKIQFEDATHSILSGYGPYEWFALAKYYPEIFNYFGRGIKKSIFTNYLNPFTQAERPAGNLYNTVESLLIDATNFFDSRQATPFKINIPEDLEGPALISYLLQDRKCEGFVIGEVHSHRSSKKFLIEHMENLKAAGVKTIFVEHLMDTLQQDLDQYILRDNPNSQMPIVLEAYLDYFDEGFLLRERLLTRNKNNRWMFKELVQAAKVAGLRVVGLDTEASYSTCNTSPQEFKDRVDSEKRMKAVNYQAFHIISKEKGSGKFVALLGSCHACSYVGVPGVANLLECPSLFLQDGLDKQVQANFILSDEDPNSRFSLAITSNPYQ